MGHQHLTNCTNSDSIVFTVLVNKGGAVVVLKINFSFAIQLFYINIILFYFSPAFEEQNENKQQENTAFKTEFANE